MSRALCDETTLRAMPGSILLNGGIVRAAAIGVFVGFAACGATTPPSERPEAVALRPNPSGPAPTGMVLVPGGVYAIGSETGDADERPVHRVALDPFFVDATEVTNADFARFVAATGY